MRVGECEEYMHVCIYVCVDSGGIGGEGRGGDRRHECVLQ